MRIPIDDPGVKLVLVLDGSVVLPLVSLLRFTLADIIQLLGRLRYDGSLDSDVDIIELKSKIKVRKVLTHTDCKQWRPFVHK